MIVMRKLAAILVADIVGYSRLAGADEDRILARLRALRSDLIDPAFDVHNGRIVKRTGDGVLAEFRSVVDAVRCAIEIQNGLIERNAGVPPERRIEFRIGIHVGDVVEEGDGDLMGDGVNIAARLEGIATPGAIALSEDAWRQVRGRLDLSATDLGAKELKNIAEPMRVYSVEVGQPAAPKPAPLEPQAARPGPPRLSLVVLPFANLGGGADFEHFVDGVTESLTTDLARLANALVVARNTAFTYKGRTVEARQIGRDLNVRYILEGSIQFAANRIRVNVQLIDGVSGNHLWADRFDKPTGDLFDLQDEIVSRLANQLRGELFAVEAQRAGQEPNPDSMDYYFQGVAAFNISRRDNFEHARRMFARAVELDPTNIDALVGAARVDVVVAAYVLFGQARLEKLAAAESLLLKGLSFAPRNHWAHMWLGFVYILSKRGERGVGELERALALDRNLGAAHAWMGLAKITLGRAEEAAAHVDEAYRISPAESVSNMWRHTQGLARLHLGQDEEAADLFRRSLDENRNFPLSYFHLAAALAALGRAPDAQIELQGGLALTPDFTIENYRNSAESDNPVYLKQRERVIENLVKAGAPLR